MVEQATADGERNSHEAVANWIWAHRDDMAADISRLVQVKSVSVPGDARFPYGAECAAVLEEYLALGRTYGLEAENCDYQCGMLSLGQGKRTVGVWGHLDVVEAGEGWLYPPYECVRKDDFLIGRGVQDNKGPAVAVLYALRCIKELGLPLNYQVKQIVGCNEEQGMNDAAYFLKYCEVPDVSLVADCGFPVCYGEKGCCNIKLRTERLSERVESVYGGQALNIVPGEAGIRLLRDLGEVGSNAQKGAGANGTICVMERYAEGMTGHTAFPEGTVNAIAVMCQEILDEESEVRQYLSESDRQKLDFIGRVCEAPYGAFLGIGMEDPAFGPLTCVGSLLKMDKQDLTLTVNIRYPMSIKIAELYETVSNTAAAYGFTAELMDNSNPGYYDPESPLVKKLMTVYHESTGDNAQPYVMGGGTYAKKLPNAVGFGPGLPAELTGLGLPDGHGACHGPDEAQSITNLCKAAEIYVHALLELSNI